MHIALYAHGIAAGVGVDGLFYPSRPRTRLAMEMETRRRYRRRRRFSRRHSNAQGVVPRVCTWALFHESADAVSYSSPVATEQPRSWPRRKADESHSLSKVVSDAASRRDFLAVERLAIKLLSLARQGDTRGIQELAGVAPTITPPPNLTGLSAHSRLSGETVNCSLFIISVSVSAPGHLQAYRYCRASWSRRLTICIRRRTCEVTSRTCSTYSSPSWLRQLNTPTQSCRAPRPSYAHHLQVSAFPHDAIIKHTHHAKRITLREPRLLELASPCHALGDLHRNLVDLNFFKTLLWPA